MTPLSALVLAVRRYIAAAPPRRGLVGARAGRESVLYYADHPRYPRYHSLDYVCIVYADGSAQLLSRDEDECLLFATLWELER